MFVPSWWMSLIRIMISWIRGMFVLDCIAWRADSESEQITASLGSMSLMKRVACKMAMSSAVKTELLLGSEKAFWYLSSGMLKPHPVLLSCFEPSVYICSVWLYSCRCSSAVDLVIAGGSVLLTFLVSSRSMWICGVCQGGVSSFLMGSIWGFILSR